jgi:methylmalonyl-CoA mutase
VKPSSEALAAWRAQVEKELAGAPFEKLVTKTDEGLAIQPLYTETGIDPGLPGAAPFTRGAHAEAKPFKICMKLDPPGQRRPGALEDDVNGGADALWLGNDDLEAIALASQRNLPLIYESTHRALEGERSTEDHERRLEERGRKLEALGYVVPTAPWWGCHDPITHALRGELLHGDLFAHLRLLKGMADYVLRGPDAGAIRVSGLPFHDAGADTADEIALMLASAATYLRALTEGGIAAPTALAAMWTQIAIGRDTFGEVCKLRALRVCWHKLAIAVGVPDAAPPMLHAVCSARTQSQRDPWVNMLRVTTQVFAAALGGADMITPLAFDEALGPASALGRREARNAALVLREESHLGRVIDPAGGSYYLETRTDQLAREAWKRFTEIERDGGIEVMIAQDYLADRLDAAWAKRAAALARRKEPVLGVSEFANLDEKLPAAIPLSPAHDPRTHPRPLVVHREAEGFEALRTNVEAAPKHVALILLGPPSEHRGRLGYAQALFATAGVRVTEITAPETGGALGDLVATLDVACLCGSDERYAAEAVAHANELRAAGAKKIVLAGRPGALEADLRAAGITAFIFVGCDVLATLTELLS